MRVSLNWLKDYVDIRIAPEAVAEKLTMAGLEATSLTRIDQDTVMEIEVTPNRSDCLSIIGIARELAAITGKKLKLPKIGSFRGSSFVSVPIQIQAKLQCPRYLGRAIKNVKVGPSPEWLVRRLEVMGVRPVNNIVDVTNFCLLEFGQPLHAFDLDKLQGPRIIVRLARAGEELVTIDGVRRKLAAKMLVIADKVKPQAIAGIMGAKDSEVNEASNNILLESAYFNPLSVHDTSRKLALATQSSYRFERGVDLKGVWLASLRATELLKKLASGSKGRGKKFVIGKAIDKGLKKSRGRKVRLRFRRVEQLLGTAVSPAQIKEIFRRLQFVILRKSQDALAVSIPSFRRDIGREADLIEEVARLYGYDNIATSVSSLAPNLNYAGGRRLFTEQTYNSVRRVLASCGLSEIMTYSLISRQALRKLGLPPENAIAVKNPLSYEQEILRPTLLAGMLNALLTNINRKNSNLKLFELSRVYLRSCPPETIEEATHLCIGMAGKKNDNWMQKLGEFNFFDLKGVFQSLLLKLGVENFSFRESDSPLFVPGRSASVMLGQDCYGTFGELSSEVLARFDLGLPVYAGELSLHKLITHIRQEKRFLPLVRFPAIERDISLLAPQELRSEQIIALINKIGREKVTRVSLFDQYSGEQIPEGFRGLAYSIEYRSPERTLTSEEVDKLHKQIRRALTEELKVQIR